MKILIACDKFRGSLEGREVAESLKAGILKVDESAKITIKEIADGGEGSLTLLSEIYQCSPLAIQTNDAIGRSINSSFGFNPTTKVAVLEMASYVGLASLSKQERDPLTTSSYGLGQAINAAIAAGAKHLIIGVGGSASNDGGAGMLESLGFLFLDQNQQVIHPNGGNLHTIRTIEIPKQKLPEELRVTIASDVSNPICGSNGATFTYAPQKGAKEMDLPFLEEGMQHFAGLLQGITGNSVLTIEGYGAAGGVPMAACELLGAEITSGSQLIFDQLGLEKLISESDVVITGEGKIDHQTLHGKAISPIVASTIAQNKKLFLICGLYEHSSPELDRHSRYELASLAKELNLESFKNASQLCYEAGKLLGVAISS